MSKTKLIKSQLLGLVYHKRLSLFTLILSVVFVAFVWNISGPVWTAVRVNDDAQTKKCCLVVSVLNIGQGDSIYIKAPNGNSMLIDAGPAGGQVSARIQEVTNMFDRNIDVLLATHPDADHIGGFQEVLSHYSAGLYIDPAISDPTATYTELLKKIDDLHIQKLVGRRGLQIFLDKDLGIEFDVLYPDDALYAYRYDECEAANAEHKRLHKKGSLKNCKNVFKLETNTASIVGKLVYGKTSFLFTGDAPIEVENYLMHEFPSGISSSTASSTLDSDVLKVGHHGSKNSTSAEFVRAVSPTYAAISVGAKNRYGHPAEQVLHILSQASSTPLTVRTDQAGTIRFSSDGEIVTYIK
jgi:competence protein ComEC